MIIIRTCYVILRVCDYDEKLRAFDVVFFSSTTNQKTNKNNNSVGVFFKLNACSILYCVYTHIQFLIRRKKNQFQVCCPTVRRRRRRRDRWWKFKTFNNIIYTVSPLRLSIMAVRGVQRQRMGEEKSLFLLGESRDLFKV